MRPWCPLALVAVLSIKWMTSLVHAQSIYCDDPELCLSKRFLRFGRTVPDDAYYRLNREFYRIGRGYHPYHDKRFLRFGRSQQPDVDDLVRGALLQSNEPYYRKKRSAELLDQSAEAANHATDHFGHSDAAKSLKKRDVDSALQDGVDKRFMRFGRGFPLEDEMQKRFMRFGKRFMRFGREPAKRFMRFGRNWEPEKRFMRFGRMLEAGKRFMRFGKREDDDEDDLEDQFANESSQKRFYRFGKSLSADDTESDDNDSTSDIDAKRFMRFGKRFMRFGKRDADAMENSDDVNTL